MLRKNSESGEESDIRQALLFDRAESPGEQRMANSQIRQNRLISCCGKESKPAKSDVNRTNNSAWASDGSMYVWNWRFLFYLFCTVRSLKYSRCILHFKRSQLAVHDEIAHLHHDDLDDAFSDAPMHDNWPVPRRRCDWMSRSRTVQLWPSMTEARIEKFLEIEPT